MKKKDSKELNPIRLAGQRPITSTLLFRSSNRSSNGEDRDDDGSHVTRSSGSGEKMSLSDFLSRKTHKHSVPVLPGTTTTTKDNEKTISLLSRGKLSGLITAHNGDKKGNREEQKCVLDKAIFDKFKPVGKDVDEECINSFIGEDVASWTGGNDVVQESGKRRRVCNDSLAATKNTAKRRLIVLGDDPKPGSSIIRRTYSRREEDKRHYDHCKYAMFNQHQYFNRWLTHEINDYYTMSTGGTDANGKGWWDSSMEGIDNDEVGFSEIWEGVGSTTLGGLDWH